MSAWEAPSRSQLSSTASATRSSPTALPIGSDNPALREWHTKELARLPGLKFMRTLWLCNVAGGPQGYVGEYRSRPPSLEEAHRDLHIAPDEFDAVAGILAKTLDDFKIPATEKDEVLAAFAAHKGEVTEGSREPATALS